jgi:medium-chain acyl-[acyl-carrier-protein] hydrolase
VDFVLPTIRADLAAAETWVPTDTTPLATPLVAVAGNRDMMAPSDAVAEWRLFAGGAFYFHLLEGDHFFLYRHAERVLSFAAPGLEGD